MTATSLNQISYAVFTAATGLYMSGNSFLMPDSHMIAAPILAYAIGAELAPIALGAYAIAHGIKYGYKVFSESEASSAADLAKATVGGLLTAATSAAIGVTAYSIATSKLAGDVQGLIYHGADTLLSGKTHANCNSLKLDVSKVGFDIIAPFSSFFKCKDGDVAVLQEQILKTWATGEIGEGTCATLFGLMFLAIKEVQELIGECPY